MLFISASVAQTAVQFTASCTAWAWWRALSVPHSFCLSGSAANSHTSRSPMVRLLLLPGLIGNISHILCSLSLLQLFTSDVCARPGVERLKVLLRVAVCAGLVQSLVSCCVVGRSVPPCGISQALPVWPWRQGRVYVDVVAGASPTRQQTTKLDLLDNSMCVNASALCHTSAQYESSGLTHICVVFCCQYRNKLWPETAIHSNIM